MSPSEQQRRLGPARRADVEPGGGRALLLAASGVLLSSALWPWGILGLALEIAAIVVGVRTLRRAKAGNRRAPGARAAVAVGSFAVAFFVVALAFVGFFFDEYRDYRTCLDRAITDSAGDACRSQFDRSIRDRIGL